MYGYTKRVRCSDTCEEHTKLIYNDATILLAVTIADNALFSIRSIEDVRQMGILLH